MVTTGFRLAQATLFAAACAAGCADNAQGPAPAPTLLVAQVGGIWGGQLTLTGSVARFEGGTGQAGEQCLDEQLVSALGTTSEATMIIEQTSATLSARVSAERVGLSCQYSGSANLSTLAMSASSCTATGLFVECGRGIRQLRLVGSSIVADVRGGTITGTASNTYNIFEGQNAALGSFVVNQDFRAVRR
jgi:hypothetical protein